MEVEVVDVDALSVANETAGRANGNEGVGEGNVVMWSGEEKCAAGTTVAKATGDEYGEVLSINHTRLSEEHRVGVEYGETLDTDSTLRSEERTEEYGELNFECTLRSEGERTRSSAEYGEVLDIDDAVRLEEECREEEFQAGWVDENGVAGEAAPKACNDDEDDDPDEQQPHTQHTGGADRLPFHLRDFRQILSEALSIHRHLLHPAEVEAMQRFLSLDQQQQSLFARLYFRRRGWHRVSVISYDEVADVPGAVRGLAEAGFVHLFDATKFATASELCKAMDDSLIARLSVPQLREILRGQRGVGSNTTKQDLQKAVRRALDGLPGGGQTVLPFMKGRVSRQSSQLASAIGSKLGVCVRVDEGKVRGIAVAHQLFLLRPPRDALESVENGEVWSDWGHPPTVLFTGMTRWHSLPRPQESLFTSRGDLDAYLEALVRAQQVAVCKAKMAARRDDLFKAVQPHADWAVAQLAQHVTRLPISLPPPSDSAEPAPPPKPPLEYIDLDADEGDDENVLLLESSGSDFSDGFYAAVDSEGPCELQGVAIDIDPPCTGCPVDHSSVPLHNQVFHPSYVQRLLLCESYEVFERAGDYRGALHQLALLLACPRFRPKRRGRWWGRICVDLKHLKMKEMAMRVLAQALAAEENSHMAYGDRLDLERRVVSLAKGEQASPVASVPMLVTEILVSPRVRRVVARKWQGSVGFPTWDLDSAEVLPQGDPVPEVPEAGDAFASGRPSLGGVEQAALAAVKRMEPGWEGSHCEGSTLKFLFSLLLWDSALFNPSFPEYFPCRFQVAPLDMGLPEYYTRREGDIVSRVSHLAGLSHEELCAELEVAWKAHENVCSVGGQWDRFPLDQLKEVATCIGPPLLSRLCKEFAQNTQFSGLPDLLLWNIGKKEVLLSEVKGPGDRLSTKQEVWLTRLANMGFPCEVCYVIEVGGQKKAVKRERTESSGGKGKKPGGPRSGSKKGGKGSVDAGGKGRGDGGSRGPSAMAGNVGKGLGRRAY
eukprot:Sspe_Gene.70920::Locus_41917_Transcript_1_1_Confidence_1.000_Length_3160::g.70920::m.70920/K15363/FAN1, MTMR15; fanconi-associated nuclease 1